MRNLRYEFTCAEIWTWVGVHLCWDMHLWFTFAEVELQGFTCAEMNWRKRFVLRWNSAILVLLSYSGIFGGNCCQCKCAEIFWKCKFCLLAWMEKCWVIASSPPSGNNSALFAFPNCQISGAEIFVLSYFTPFGFCAELSGLPLENPWLTRRHGGWQCWPYLHAEERRGESPGGARRREKGQGSQDIPVDSCRATAAETSKGPRSMAKSAWE